MVPHDLGRRIIFIFLRTWGNLRESVTGENGILSLTFSHVKANEEEISQGKIHETRVRQASSLACRVARKGGSKATEHIQPQPDVGVDPGLQVEPGKQSFASHISDFVAPLQKSNGPTPHGRP